ncbi:sensor histidine kinase [Ihubacter massiliensis]|uniref:histidine kinase n=1 Tax=Hominibacterium faecale TaxID=2839743 RepID=A0A9J6QR12_9FIRM|nr:MULTISPECIES: sensor histidine kinase [Eubacteriales Family XIII. Incertae Sedis]MCO7123376.1 sensor histidine kinase [Ihubacter massiliensis]MCU7379681.1 sensor histidine kinase [Hominibacterium faecale]
MKKIFKRVVILIILGALLIALPIEIIGLIRNQNAFEKEAKDKIEYATKSAGTDLDVVINSMSSLVNMMQSIVQVTFSHENYIDDYDTFLRLKHQAGDILKQSLSNTEHLSGLYVTFSPQLHSSMEEVWYAYKDGRVVPIDARMYAPSWLVEGNPRVNYYFDAIKNGDYWGAPDYESSLDEYMLTHTKSVYDSDGNLIGIVGSDMLMSEVDDILKAIKLYSDSQIILFDAKLNFCASSDNVKNPAKFYAPLVSQIASLGADQEPVWYTSSDGKKHIAAYTTLNNGWILATTQTVATVMTPATETRTTLMITMFVTVSIIVVIAILLIKRFYGPVVKSAQQNEILLINQSRQAKLGEMIGNISHQCKQPLNNINIDISNMKDDYDAGELTWERFKEYETKMRENVSIMSSTITDFADFLKPDRRKERFFIKDSVEKALSIMREKLVINEINIMNEVDPELTIINYRNEFIQCIFNILENARDGAILSEIKPRIIKIDSDQRDTAQWKIISLRIFNSGGAIPKESSDKIFLPYYSTKEKDGGSGIGLYLAKQIIESHFGGEIGFRNEKAGVTFIITMKERKQ